jgi:flagellar motor switch protein FliM
MRSLQRLHTVAADALQDRLARMYGVNPHVRLDGVEEVAFGLLKEAIPDFAYATVLDVSPLGTLGVMYIDSALCLAFVDRVLGGFSSTPPEARALTAIDEAAVESVLHMILNTLQTHWKEFCEVRFTVRERKTDAQLVQLWSPTEVVFAITLDVSGAMGEGKIRVCVPVSRLKAAVDGFAIRSATLEASPEQTAKLRNALRMSLEKASLPMTACFADVEVPIRNLVELRQGDILRLDHPADDPVVVSVGPRESFLGRMGLRGRRKAVQVLERIQECED